jgi:ribonucleoside-triphosphate reductase
MEKNKMDLSQKILSDITHHMKYAKFLPDQFRRETFEETVDRNVQMHVKKFPHLEDEIRSAYTFVYDRKVLPSMRSMQFAGEAIEKNNSRIFNCSFVPMDHQRAFSEIMFLLLSGCGVGFSVQTHHIEKLPEIRKPNDKRTIKFLIGDSVEGWADSIKAMIKSYFEGTSKIRFDYSDIRPKGARLVTAGGKAPGPQPLKECLIKIEGILEQKENGDKLSSIEVHDIVCVIADAVLAGGIRRSALISFFDADDHEMISCKSGSWWETHPYRGRANNSAVLMRSKITESFFMNLWEKIQMSGSGEPGIMLTNDKDVLGNPCNEVALRSNQMCNLVEINASDIVDQEDYNNRVRSAAFIATLQASYTDFHYLRDIWKRTTEKEALIGVSMTGVASNKIFELNIKEAAEIVKNENERVAELIKINKAARTTTCKPAGTTSLIFGTSSGIHAWHDKFYIRRIRVGKNEPIYAYLKQNHPALIEDEYFRPHDTAVICVPQKAPDNSTLRNEETSLELLERIKQVHADWIKPGHRKGANTNNVSATISVKPDEWDVVGQWMWENRDSYTGLSVLPFSDHTYIQAPFETCTEEEYNRLFQSLQSVDLSQIFESEDETDLQGELACAGAGCIVV